DVETYLAHPLSGVSGAERAAVQEKLKTKEGIEVPGAELALTSGSYRALFVPRTGNKAVLEALHALLDGVLTHRQYMKNLRHIEAVLMMAVKKAVNLLEEGLSQYPELSLSFLCALIRKVFQSISAPIEGEPLKGIQIMGLLES